MARLFLILVAVLSIGAQETAFPPDHYCQNHAPRKTETRAHECHCGIICEQDADGTWTYREDQTCKLFCKHERCSCHPEEVCPKPA